MTCEKSWAEWLCWCRTVICDTPQENTPAIRFMGRLGFADPVYHVRPTTSPYFQLSRHSIYT